MEQLKRMAVFATVVDKGSMVAAATELGMTASAVSTFQQKHASEILAPAGLTRGTGSVYASTRVPPFTAAVPRCWPWLKRPSSVCWNCAMRQWGNYALPRR